MSAGSGPSPYGAGGGGGAGNTFTVPASVSSVRVTLVGGGGGGGQTKTNLAPLEDPLRLYSLLRRLKKWRGFRMLPHHIRDDVVMILNETEKRP